MIVEADGLTENEVISAIEVALANEANLHPSDISVSYDLQTGEVNYTITNKDANAISEAINQLQSEELSLPETISIEVYTSPNDMVVIVDVSVDASDVDDVDSAISNVIQELTRDLNKI